MGYNATQVKSQFFIADEDKYPAYKAIKAVFGTKSWFEDCRCLEDVLSQFGFYTEIDANDNICKIRYEGDKLGGEKTMFSLLAPYVKSGSFIDICGEDGDQWRWEFNDGKFSEKKAKVSFD